MDLIRQEEIFNTRAGCSKAFRGNCHIVNYRKLKTGDVGFKAVAHLLQTLLLLSLLALGCRGAGVAGPRNRFRFRDTRQYKIRVGASGRRPLLLVFLDNAHSLAVFLRFFGNHFQLHIGENKRLLRP